MRNLTLAVVIAAGIGGLVPRLTGLRIIWEFYVETGMVLSGLEQILMSLLYIVVLFVTIWTDMSGMVFRR